MSRYIDADALMKRLLKLKVVTDNMYGMGIARGIERAETAIQMQPTADVEEVRHGEWDTKCNASTSGGLNRYVHGCSNCDYFYKTVVPIGYKYCPNCGAKMKRITDDEG